MTPPPPPIPVVPLGALPVWDTSPPRSSRILVHQILQKVSNSKPTPTTAPGSEKRKGNSGADISKVHHVDAIAYILDLRREIDTRLTYDADPPVSGQESVFEEFHLDTAFN
ncbi:hypothetical protein AC1031_004836 [Aphanomyces cochlioides]|nr:hypothetical protein AC1031_004836 [Aphanomyces cochlioides]